MALLLKLVKRDGASAGRLLERLRGPVQRADLTALDWTMKRIAEHVADPVAHAPDLRREIDQAHEQIRALVAALEDGPVPVARAVTMRDDDSVLGAPFQMVEYVPGRVVRLADELDTLGGPAVISGCVDALIKVLADLHAVDPDAVGLGDFGRPDGYLERQVRRWGSQWELVRLPDDSREADVQRLYSTLAQSIPAQSRTSIVHGDYRIDNTILDTEDATVVRAVLDWEMSTLGDPLSDAALMCIYRDPIFGLVHAEAAWASEKIPAADELAHRYSLAAGQPLRHWDFYMALACFKLAIIAAGIIPAGLEMMDKPMTAAVEGFVHAGYDLDAAAILLCESDGTPEEVEEEIGRMSAVLTAAGATAIAVSESEAQRLKFWSGRKNAFPASGRISPDYMCMDSTIPRKRLADILQAISEMEEKYALKCLNVFHAGDGNLHPLILFDANDPDQLHRCELFGADILETSVAMGGTVTGEHGVGIEKVNSMCVQFSSEENEQMFGVKRAFDPNGLLNPGKVIPTLHRCAEYGKMLVRAGQIKHPDLPRF